MRGAARQGTSAGGLPLRLGLGLAICIAAISCSSEEQDSEGAPPAITRAFERGDVRVTLTLDRETLTIAETVAMRLEVESAESAEVVFPDSRDGFGEFAVLRDDAVQARLLEDGRVVRGQEYVLQPFLPGEYELPPLKLSVGGGSEVTTDSVSITVLSVLEDPEVAELQESTDPIDIPLPWWWAVAGTGLGLALAAAGWWWWRRRSKAGSGPPALPAHERALAAIEVLVGQDLLSHAGFKPFFLRLSEIVRRYVEERFGLRAPERTTQEFLAEMASAASIRAEHQALLRDFLAQADMVKFAEFVPTETEADAAVGAARQFIQQTAPADSLQS